VAFWTRDKSDDTELIEYAAWVKEIREPDVDNEGIRRLEQEIRAKEHDILSKLGQHYVRPRLTRISDIRREVDTLAGMVFAWLYVSGKHDSSTPITGINDDVNDLSMMWLDVNLREITNRAYPQKDRP
jgi:hypothetical protein